MLAEAILIGSVAAIGAGLTVASRFFSTRRMFERHKLIPIADAKEGSVSRVRGLARPGGGELLSSPLTGRPCVAWVLHVSQLRGAGDMANYVCVLDERTVRPFFVDDADETAFVSGDSIHIDLREDEVFDSSKREPPDGLEAHLADRGVDMLTGAPYIVREGILAVGEPVTVVGKGRWESDPSRPGEGYRSVGRRLVIDDGPKGSIHISDDPSLTKKKKKKNDGDGSTAAPRPRG